MKSVNSNVAPVAGVPGKMANDPMTDKKGNQQRFNEGDDQEVKNEKKRGLQDEDQFFKKQMEFKSGKRHQLITDQFVNSNKIYANRYNGLLGVWYFVIDCIYHFENFLAVVLFFLIMMSEKYNDVSASFPIVTLSVNITLMAIRNVTFELR